MRGKGKLVSIALCAGVCGGVVAAPQGEESMEEIVVIGTRGSLMSAIDKQQASDSFISVVDSDALGDFPDTTAAEAVRRLSGISIENDQGEGRYVTIRGLSSDLNAFAINGASMVAPENDRSVLLDGVPTELLESITVSKSLTPDQDVDSIGGRIDFTTKNPSDLTEPLLKIKLDTTYNEQTESASSPRLSLNYGYRVSDQFAHVLGLTYSEKEIVTYNNETGYGWDSDGLMNDDWEMRYYDIVRKRAGITYDMDYLLNSRTRAFASVFWNEYTDDELRWKDEYGKIEVSEPLASGMTTERIRHDAETRVREEVRTISSFTVGAETVFDGGWAADFQASYSFAEEDDSDNADVTFRNDDEVFGGEVYWTDPEKPYVIAYDPNLRNPAHLELDELEIEQSVSKDTEVAFSFDIEKEFDVAIVKFGGKYRSREKDRDNNKEFYVADGVTLADFDPQTLAWPFANQVFGPQANRDRIFALRHDRPGFELDDTETFLEDFIIDEDVLAVYGMGTFVIGEARIVAGIRFEDTRSDSSAFDQDGAVVTANKDYSFWAPSVNVRYAMDNGWVLRAAAWRSLSRPGFTAIAPVLELEVNGDDISGSFGNPELEPYESTNLDLAFEFYGDGMTFVSLGIFHKDIDNAIYKTVQKNARINGISFNDGVSTSINAEQSTVTGLEANLQYGWENGFFVAVNLTHMIDNESTFRFEDSNTYTTPFRKLADDSSNLSLGYDAGPWDVRLAMNYRSEYLDWLADDEDEIDSVSDANSRFVDDHMQWDLTAKYQWNDNLTLKFEMINIGDEPEHYYWGDASRLSQYDEYGTSYSFGFTYKR